MHEIHHLPSIFREKRLDTRFFRPIIPLSLSLSRSNSILSISLFFDLDSWRMNLACRVSKPGPGLYIISWSGNRSRFPSFHFPDRFHAKWRDTRLDMEPIPVYWRWRMQPNIWLPRDICPRSEQDSAGCFTPVSF